MFHERCSASLIPALSSIDGLHTTSCPLRIWRFVEADERRQGSEGEDVSAIRALDLSLVWSEGKEEGRGTYSFGLAASFPFTYQTRPITRAAHTRRREDCFYGSQTSCPFAQLDGTKSESQPSIPSEGNKAKNRLGGRARSVRNAEGQVKMNIFRLLGDLSHLASSASRGICTKRSWD
jgi:hypothetical protein